MLLHRQPIGEDRFVNDFSVNTMNLRTAKGRAFVKYEGEDSGHGTWSCSKDRVNACSHISSAREHLSALLRVEMSVPEEGTDAGEYWATSVPGVVKLITHIALMVRVRKAAKGFISISYLPILPPIWSILETDDILYERRKPQLDLPEGCFSLDMNSSCPCGPSRTFYDPNLPKSSQDCVLYTLSETHKHTIDLQPCRTCPGRRRRHIGPDPRNLGVFNYNNRILVTHALLDEYTAAYTTSETPFVAWVSIVNRRYQVHESQQPFMSEQMFRAVWFAYVNLQKFEQDMKCPKCGPTPDNVVWDGVTLGFSQKHLLDSLRPPTISHDDSPVRKHRYIAKQQVLIDKDLRKLLRAVIAGPFTLPQLSKTENGEAYLARLEKIPEVHKKLQKLDPSLGEIFRAKFGVDVAARKPDDAYIRLFHQVCPLL